MKRKILELIGFCIVTLVLFFGVSYALADRETTFSAVYSEPDNSVDVLIVGSSHVNSGYIPSLLWENNGLSSVNAFSWSQPMWVSYHYIVEALKTQSPEYIVLEMYGMTYGHSYIMPEEIDKTSYNNSFNLDPSWNRWQLIKTSEFCGLDLRNAEDFLYISRYHTRWKDFDWSYLSYNAHDQHDYLKGYGFLTSVAERATPVVDIAQEVLTPYEYCVEYLEKIVALCENEGIELIFTLTPYIYASEETGVINWIEQYSREKGIPFFNYLYGEDYERIGFDYSADLADTGHCNFYGATKITTDLCDYLNKADHLPAKKENHSHYEMLAEDYSRYERIPAVNVIMSNNNLVDWLDSCLNDGSVSLFINTHSATEDTEAIIESCLSNNNISANADNIIISKMPYSQNGSNIDFDMFGADGTVEFSTDSAEIYLNGTAAPGETQAELKIVMYDNVLQRPVVAAWLKGGQFSSKEFTSDILDNYK